VKVGDSRFRGNDALSSADETEQAAGLFRLLRKTTVCAAIIFFIIQAVPPMQYAGNIEFLAANISLALLSVFYAALLILIFINPAIAVLNRNQAN
jgi:hypothetical protein